MKTIVKLLFVFSLFSVIACAEYDEENENREDCLDNPNLPVCSDDNLQEEDPVEMETPSDSEF